MALLTLALAVVGTLQYCTFDRQLSVTRPWITAQALSLRDPLVFNDGPLVFQLTLKVKNSGVSIAKNINDFTMPVSQATAAMEKEWGHSCSNLEHHFSRALEGQKTGYVLAPGDDYDHPIMVVEKRLTGTSVISDLKAGSGGFAIIGCIEYMDQFLAVHKTRFCFEPLKTEELSPLLQSNVAREVKQITFRRCVGYQDAD